MLELILEYYELGNEYIAKGVPLVRIRRLQVVQDIARARFNVSNDDLSVLDKLQLKLEKSIAQLGSIYDDK